MSWASIVSKSSSQPTGQVSQTGLASSPQVPASGGVAAAKKSKDIVSCDPTTSVAMVTDNRLNEGGAWGSSNAAQQQSPPLNPAQSRAELANLGSKFEMSFCVSTQPYLSLSLSLSPSLSSFLSPRSTHEMEDRPHPRQHTASRTHQPRQLVLHACCILLNNLVNNGCGAVGVASVSQTGLATCTVELSAKAWDR